MQSASKEEVEMVVQALSQQIGSAFSFLSESILEGRKRESKLRQRITDLEMRLWEMEGHTVEESIEFLSRTISEWSSETGDFESSSPVNET